MEKELKTLLVILSKFIKTIGCEKAIFDFSYDGNSYYQNKMRCDGNYINMPIEISPFLEKYLDQLPDFQGEADNGSEYHGYEMIFDPTTMTITTYGQYTEYDTQDGGSSSVEIDEEVITQFEELISKGSLLDPFHTLYLQGNYLCHRMTCRGPAHLLSADLDIQDQRLGFCSLENLVPP
mgnify:CR=1 FL=1